MTPEQAIEELRQNSGGDAESAHITADRVLLDVMRAHEDKRLSALADEWEKLDNRSGGFWYA